jgi:hypothetical protein
MTVSSNFEVRIKVGFTRLPMPNLKCNGEIPTPKRFSTTKDRCFYHESVRGVSERLKQRPQNLPNRDLRRFTLSKLVCAQGSIRTKRLRFWSTRYGFTEQGCSVNRQARCLSRIRFGICSDRSQQIAKTVGRLYGMEDTLHPSF